jgi:cyclophilin family peptidyl-prolyl cis-trans isomerase
LAIEILNFDQDLTMTFRIGCGFLLTSIFFATAPAEVVRFQTDVGNIDMVLNPANDSRLQEHVDNLIDYVEARRYHCTVVNRAAEDFVLQMGSFFTTTLVAPSVVNGFEPIDTFDPINGAPASTITGLSNTRGTVAMALPSLSGGGTNQNGGTSSFFVNLGDNSAGLDPDFTVFAQIPDMETVDKIMGLNQVNLTEDPSFGASSGNLAFSDVPLQDNGNQVFIQQAFLLEDTIAVAAATNAALAQLFDPSLVSTAPATGSTPAPAITPTIRELTTQTARPSPSAAAATSPTVMSTPPAAVIPATAISAVVDTTTSAMIDAVSATPSADVALPAALVRTRTTRSASTRSVTTRAIPEPTSCLLTVVCALILTTSLGQTAGRPKRRIQHTS